MARFSVFVTRVTEYEVEADTSEDAQDAVLTQSSVNGSGYPQVIDETTSRTEVVEIDERMVVQIVFSRTGGTYAYAVPEGLSVRIGDTVVVPGTAYKGRSVVQVVDVGRGSYTGPLKAIIGKVITEDDLPVDAATQAENDGIEAARNDEDAYDEFEDKGFGFCPDCGVAYLTEDSHPCGGMMS